VTVNLASSDQSELLAGLPPALDRPCSCALSQLKQSVGGSTSSGSQLESWSFEQRRSALGLVGRPRGAGQNPVAARLALFDPLQAGTIHLQGPPAGVVGLPRWRSLVCFILHPAGPVAHGGTVGRRTALTLVHSRSGGGRGGWRRERITDLCWGPCWA